MTQEQQQALNWQLFEAQGGKIAVRDSAYRLVKNGEDVHKYSFDRFGIELLKTRIPQICTNISDAMTALEEWRKADVTIRTFTIDAPAAFITTYRVTVSEYGKVGNGVINESLPLAIALALAEAYGITVEQGATT
jgi:hypothetical protein